MVKVVILCDRCGKQVEGLRFEGGTSGFYEGPYWEQYMKEGEKQLCDCCMQSGESYRVAYMPGPPPEGQPIEKEKMNYGL